MEVMTQAKMLGMPVLCQEVANRACFHVCPLQRFLLPFREIITLRFVTVPAEL